MLEKYGKGPPELVDWTIPQWIAVMSEPKDNLKAGEVECGSLEEALAVSKKLKEAEAAQNAPD